MFRKNQQKNLRNCQSIYFDSDFYIFKTEIFIFRSFTKMIFWISKIIKYNLGK